MKFVFLDLLAFGPFEKGERIRFDARGGLSLVYGDNEAGKSSALRAIGYFLYQMPGTIHDAFRYPYNQIRIGAKLEDPDGIRAHFIRRKTAKANLRDEADRAVVPEAALSAFTHGVTKSAFDTLFGLGHQDLVKGGLEMVRGAGSLGELIFAAGTGIRELRSVQDQMEEQARDLFLAGGKKPVINQDLAELTRLKQEMEAVRLDHESWRACHDSVARTKQALGDLKQNLVQVQIEKNRLERIQNALPHVSRYFEIQDRLDRIKDIPLLPSGFGEELDDLIQKAHLARRDLESAQNLWEDQDRDQKAVMVPQGLLTHEKRIEALYQDLGRQTEAGTERIGRRAAVAEKTRAAGRILARLAPGLPLEKAEDLRVSRAMEARLRDLETRHKELTAGQTALAGQKQPLNKQRRDLEENLEQLGQPRDVNPIIRLLETAEKTGQDIRSLMDLEKDIQAEEDRLNLDKARLQALWDGSLTDLARIKLPDAQGVDEAATALQGVTDEVYALQKNLDENQVDQERTKARLLDLEKSGPLVSESDMADSRSLRDAGWALVRSQMENRELDPAALSDFMKHFPGADHLADAFEQAVKEADLAADKLREEAGRTAEKARLLDRLDTLKQEKQAYNLRFQTAGGLKEELNRQWLLLWAPSAITPDDPPAGMKNRLAKFSDMSREAAEILAKKQQAKTQRKQVRALCRELAAALGMEKDPALADADEIKAFDLVLDAAKTAVKQAQTHTQTQKEIQRDLEKIRESLTRLETDLDKAGADLEAWDKDWATAAALLGLDQKAGPAEARAVFEDRAEMFALMEGAETARLRMDAIDKDRDLFSRSVQELAAAVALDPGEEDPMTLAEKMYARLSRARSARSEWAALEKQKKASREKKIIARELLTDLENQLKAMALQAECPDRKDLKKIAALSREKRGLQAEAEKVEAQLREFSGSMGVQAFADLAKTQNVDEIRAELPGLEAQIKDLETQKAKLHETLGKEQNELDKMDGGSKAADLAADMEMLKARIKNCAQRYAELKLAAAVLRKTVERYRKRHQGPIIQKGSEFFSQITNGKYRRLRADVDPKGNPVLVAVSEQTGKTVETTAMSEGTADQLFLALRLAGLAHHLEANPPFSLDPG